MVGLPCARPLPDPIDYGTVPLAGFRVTALPGSAPKPKNAKPKQQHGVPSPRA